MQAALIAWITIRLWTHFLAYNPELSIFVDESGEFDPVSKYYLITLVFHDQSVGIDSHLSKYRRVLSDCGMRG